MPSLYPETLNILHQIVHVTDPQIQFRPALCRAFFTIPLALCSYTLYATLIREFRALPAKNFRRGRLRPLPFRLQKFDIPYSLSRRIPDADGADEISSDAI